MWRKFVFVLLVGLLVSSVSRTTQAQDRTVFWDTWDVLIDQVDTTNNSFRVTENYDLDFQGTFRFGQRVVADTNLESIGNVLVFEAGQPLRQGCNEQPGTFCVTNVQEGTSIVYYFTNPITNSSQTFDIQYTVTGALRSYEGGDQLWWTAIPEEHFGFSIGGSTVTVQLPAGYAPREGVDPVVTYGATTNVTVEGTTVIARTTQQLDGNDFLEIRVQYPHDPDARVAGWQADFDSRRAFEENTLPLINFLTVIAAFLLGLGGPFGMFALWWTRGRDPKVGPVPEYLSDPPSDLPPGVVGTLIDEKANVRDVLATVIDLARRGYLVIEESKDEKLFGVISNTEYSFKRTDKSLDDLLPFERKVMDKLFDGKMERSMDSMKNKFYRSLGRLQDDLYDELTGRNLFKTSPKTIRGRYTAIGQFAFFGMFALVFFGISAIEGSLGVLLCVPLALIPSVFAINVLGNHMPAKTQVGAEEVAKWKAFRKYLTNLEKYDTAENVATRFEQFLPYAVAFGMEKSWINRFSRVAYVPTPIWYYPTHRYGGHYRPGTPISQNLPSASDVVPGDIAKAGSGGLDSMAGGLSSGLEGLSDGLTDMLNSASRTFSSQPSSSGSSGSWSGGGSSFSGGGSFGGGSSGGGSSGFG